MSECQHKIPALISADEWDALYWEEEVIRRRTLINSALSLAASGSCASGLNYDCKPIIPEWRKSMEPLVTKLAMNKPQNTEVIDKLFLELSHVTNATTAKESQLYKQGAEAAGKIGYLTGVLRGLKFFDLPPEAIRKIDEALAEAERPKPQFSESQLAQLPPNHPARTL